MTTNSDESRGELALVRRLRAHLAGGAGPAHCVPFGDDMAALAGDHGELLWTVDMLMDGVDFDSAVHGWELIGRKAMAVNLSDCAAMGVEPVAALGAVALSNRLTLADAETLLCAAHDFGLSFGCPLVGGDTNSWDAPTVISITVAARVPAGAAAARRDGARPGDTLWVSGPLGGSILGRHLTFVPRVALGVAIAAQLAPRAMIDLSDGLALDLHRVLEASAEAASAGQPPFGALLDAAALDELAHDDARRLAEQDGRPAREHALYDGEDFELLVALGPTTPPDAARRLGLTSLGSVTADGGLRLRTPDGVLTPLAVRGWEHFR